MKKRRTKKAALKAIIADYNAQYGGNFQLGEFDLYYQDVQKRIKDQQWPNADLPHAQKIDITIVVDMLLTGFDSKYLNTLYVDKSLKFHGLIQAFSRTNRVLNDTKPYGNILDFRQQQDAVDTAIGLFSGQASKPAKEIWLVDKAPVVIEKLQTAVQALDTFMQSQGLENKPEAVANLKGDAARAQFINLFKEVQRLNTQLDQYTDLTPDNKTSIEKILPKDQLQGFKGMYIDTAQRLKEKQDIGGNKTDPTVQQLDFEFVLFASSIIDYDYIMELIARYSSQTPGKQKMSREQLIGVIQADAKFIDERDDIAEYISTLEVGKALDEKAIRAGFDSFKAEKHAKVLADVAVKHSLNAADLQAFVETTLRRMVFDGDQLSELFTPLGLGWKARTKAELALMEGLIPLFKKPPKGGRFQGWVHMNSKEEGMQMQPEKGKSCAPKLRFPKFVDAVEWKLVPLNKLAKRCAQKNRGGAITRVLTNSAEYGVVDQRDYFDRDIATQGNLESYYVVAKGDYVYNPRISARAPVGPISKNNVATGVMSPLYSVFRFGEVNNDFYAYYFKTTGWHQYMRQASSTGARHDRMAISNDDFMAMPLPVSTPEEQQNIADCIASLDECLTLESKKLGELKAHKNGLMQRLFPIYGETLPELRFPNLLVRVSGKNAA